MIDSFIHFCSRMRADDDNVRLKELVSLFCIVIIFILRDSLNCKNNGIIE